jgi:predicted dehydrogenase
VKKKIDEGEIGNVLCAQAAVYTYETLLFAKTPFREKQEWALVVDYTHEIDFLHYLVGPIEEVAAVSATLGRLDHIAAPNLLDISLKFRSNAIGHIHMDYVRHPGKRYLEVIGDRGSLELQMGKGILKVFKPQEEGVREISRPFVRDDLFRDQIDDFLQVIEGGKKPLVSLADGIATLHVADAIRESVQKKQFVRVE